MGALSFKYGKNLCLMTSVDMNAMNAIYKLLYVDPNGSCVEESVAGDNSAFYKESSETFLVGITNVVHILLDVGRCTVYTNG
jgi:hypothetical protein